MRKVYLRMVVVYALFLIPVYHVLLDYCEDIFRSLRYDGEGTFGIMSRIIFVSSYSYWYGLIYWIGWVLFMRMILERQFCYPVVIRSEKISDWVNGCLARSIKLAVLYPLLHMLVLWGMSLLKFGGNAVGAETAFFRYLYGMGMVPCYAVWYGSQAALGILLGSAAFLLAVCLRNKTSALLAAAAYTVLACIGYTMFTFDVRPYLAALPAGISISFLLSRFPLNFMEVMAASAIGSVVFYILCRRNAAGMEMDRYV